MRALAILAVLLSGLAARADLIVPTQGGPRTRGKHRQGETWVEVQLTQISFPDHPNLGEPVSH